MDTEPDSRSLTVPAQSCGSGADQSALGVRAHDLKRFWMKSDPQGESMGSDDAEKEPVVFDLQAGFAPVSADRGFEFRKNEIKGGGDSSTPDDVTRVWTEDLTLHLTWS